AIQSESDGRGERGDIELATSGNLVKFEAVLEDRDERARDDLFRLQIELLVPAVERSHRYDARSCGSGKLQLRIGDEEIGERVADRRSVGDVANQRAGAADLR